MSNIPQTFRRNYHTHTKLCNHAKGELREYVEAAVERGLEVIGFSDHAPYAFEHKFDSWFRMRISEVEGYVTELLQLKEEFRDKIDIKIGYELEYYPEFFKDTLEVIKRYPCDYLILGQHFYDNEYDGEYHATSYPETPEKFSRIVNQMCEALKTGNYSYVAHPDLCNFLGSEEDYVKTMEPLLQTCLEMDIPVEINLLGIRGRRGYPKQYLWKRIGEIGCKVVFGSDAHSPEELLCTEDFEKACEMVEKYGLNYTDEIKLISPHDVK